MSVLRFRRDRRQRDPFAGPTACRACSPEDYGRCGCPRDCGWMGCMGNRNATLAAPDYATRIDVDATLADLAAKAQAETAQMRPVPSTAPWGPWDKPGSFPEALRAVPDQNGRVYGWGDTAMDYPPPHTRPYAPAPPSSPPLADDYRSLPVFQSTVRDACGAGVKAIGVRTARIAPPAPDFRLAELMHHHFAGMLAMHPGTERAA